MKRYAFTDQVGVVVNVIVGSLPQPQLSRFLNDQRALFGAESFVIVEDDRPVWIGGTYDPSSGEFLPPPSPEPEPEPIVVDAPIEEIVEETTNDAA
jgi:hypothetical protein